MYPPISILFAFCHLYFHIHTILEDHYAHYDHYVLNSKKQFLARSNVRHLIWRSSREAPYVVWQSSYASRGVNLVVTMATAAITCIGILTLTINEKQCLYCNTIQYNKQIDQSAASIRVELMIKIYTCIYIHTYIHTNIHTYKHTYIQTYIHISYCMVQDRLYNKFLWC